MERRRACDASLPRYLDEAVRFFFALNIFLWCVLLVAWVGYVGIMGLADDVSLQVGFILALTAVLLSAQGAIRWRRRRTARVSA